MSNMHFPDSQNDKVSKRSKSMDTRFQFGTFGKSKNEAWVFSVLLRMFDGMPAQEFVEILDATPDEQK